MKALFSILFCFTVLFTPAQDLSKEKGKTTTHYYHKKLKFSKGKMLKGKPEGTWYRWNKSGTLHSIVHFHEGKLHGTYTEYEYLLHPTFPDLSIKEDYQEALKTQKTSLDTPLSICKQGDYNMGLKTGAWRTYYSGFLVEDAFYGNDTLEGTLTLYGFYGKIPSEIIHYKKGFKHGTDQRFDIKGNLLEEYNYINGKKTGAWTVYKEHEKVIKTYLNDTLHGLSASYNKNDSLLSSTIYVKGIKHGPYLETRYNGDKIKGRYVNGLKEGIENTYHNGRLHSEVYIQGGKKNGFYRVYNDTTGNVELTGFYKNDQSDSTWTSVGEYGTCMAIHKNGKIIKQDCINKGVKTKTFYIDKNRNEVTIFWHDNKFKKSENIYGNLYWINHSWDAKGKILDRDTLWVRQFNWKQENPVSDSVYANTAEAPQFKGGYKALEKYININVQYPAVDVETYIEGKVYVQFTVLPDGKVQDMEIKRSPSKTLGAEVYRVLSKMHAWQPGVRNGKTETSKVMLSINFEIPEDMLPKPIKLHQDQ